KKRKSRKPAKPETAKEPPMPKQKKTDEDKRQEALDLTLETVEALQSERGDEPVWGSMVKQALKRRKPGFNESYYGFRSFSSLLEEAEHQGLLKLERDQRSGGYIIHEVEEEETAHPRSN
ncbi:MAG: NYN domain-containing protein, partial [Acidobacteria bacterium]